MNNQVNQSEQALVMVWVETTDANGRTRLEARWIDPAAQHITHQAA